MSHRISFSTNLGFKVDLEFQPTRKYTVITSQIQGKQLHFTFDREPWNITSDFFQQKSQWKPKNFTKISEMKRNQRFGSSKVGSRLATQKVVQHQPISSLRSPSTPHSDYQGLFGRFDVLGTLFWTELLKTSLRTSIFIGWHTSSFNNIRTQPSFASTKHTEAAN